ncbi:MAG: hypothetical protein RLP44_23075 [Aggregatilineales bacterium]
MDRKLMCVSNVKYKKPTEHEGKRMKNLLKYLTYRESRDEKAHHAGGRERWMNHGMGRSATEIAERCDAYQSDHVLLFSLVINPNVDLIRMVPPEDREPFVKQLTERTVNGFFDARGIDTGVEWSAVIHHRLTDGEEAPGQHNPHTHIVLPGTYYDADEGRRKPLYFSRNKSVNHVEMLHEVTQINMVDLMDRYAGLDWEQRYDKLATIREQQEQIVYDDDQHGFWGGDPVWAGIRRTDNDTSAVGFYGFFENREGKTTLQFRPVMGDVDHQDAEILAEQLKERLKDDAKNIQKDNEPSPRLNF